jgi:hypothetical protein
MSSQNRLILSSVLFAGLWTAGMLWWSAPLDTAHIIILVIAGGIAGLLWYWLFGKWFRRRFGG